METFQYIKKEYFRILFYLSRLGHQILIHLKKRILSRQKSIEKKVYRLRRKRLIWKTKRNRLKNKLKKPKKTKKNILEFGRRTIIVPEYFSLISNKEEVLDFFNRCKNDKYRNVRVVAFDFKRVKEISHGAITTLLSITGWLLDQKINVSGNYPSDNNARRYLENSGFLKYFKRKTYINPSTENIILCTGTKHTEAEKTAVEIRKAMKTVWGEEKRNTRLQGMMIELMANTVNHAYKKHQKGWYFAVDHIQKENKVKFCFVDNGAGILNTIRYKWREVISKHLGNLTDDFILEEAFNGRFGSRTKLSNRGRGLPAVKKNLSDNIIKNLKIISNNVYYDFEDGTKEILAKQFHGTLYYWELDQTCKTWNSK